MSNILNNIEFVDTHAHLDFEDYQGAIDELIDTCGLQGVKKIIIPGVREDDSQRVLDLVSRYDNLYCAVGVHPSEAKEWTDNTYQNLKEFAENPKVVAVGETGLDYYWDKTFNDTQHFVFKEHIKLAKELNKPLIIHNRDAHADTLAILKESNAQEIGGVLHCFSGSPEFALECIKLGFYIALGGPVTFKNAVNPKEVARVIPIEKLLLETDSPFLTPHPFRGKQNDPSKIPLIAQEIAKVRNITVEEVASITTQNAKNLFGI